VRLFYNRSEGYTIQKDMNRQNTIDKHEFIQEVVKSEQMTYNCNSTEKNIQRNVDHRKISEAVVETTVDENGRIRIE
jgi:hypothetical protein